MYNEELKWIENGLDRLHETGKMGSLHWRATYTEEDQKARKLLEQWMREKDLEVFYDDVGNLFGKIEGEQDKIVLTGSHRDTVKNGGWKVRWCPGYHLCDCCRKFTLRGIG